MKFWLLFFLLLGAVLAGLFASVLFCYDNVQANNDAPLGYWQHPPQGWNDLNWLGFQSQPMNPTAMMLRYAPVWLIGFAGVVAGGSILAACCGYARAAFLVVRVIWGVWSLALAVAIVLVLLDGPEHHDVFCNYVPALGLGTMLFGFLGIIQNREKFNV